MIRADACWWRSTTWRWLYYGDNVKTIKAGLSVFRMGTDGKLTVARIYDFATGDKIMWWMGMVAL